MVVFFLLKNLSASARICVVIAAASASFLPVRDVGQGLPKALTAELTWRIADSYSAI